MKFRKPVFFPDLCPWRTRHIPAKCVIVAVADASSVGGHENEWMGCFLDELRIFGINADEWTTPAQEEGE